MSSYVDAISVYFPDRKVSCIGDGSDYEQLVSEDGLALPTQAELEPLKLTIAQDRKWREIQAKRDALRFGGVKVGANSFHSDDSSRIQQIGLMMMGANLPGGIMWKTLSGNFVLMTPTLAVQIFQATAAHDATIFAIAEQHKTAMLQLANPTTYDFSANWPSGFGE